MQDKQKEFIKSLTERTVKAAAERLSTAVAGIAGCGGLGSNIAVSLARTGIKKLILADFDKVVLSNLNRQYYFVDDIGRFKVDALDATLKKINPYLETETHIMKVTAGNMLELFSSADIIFEAFDSAEEKTMIINAFLDADFPDKFLVCASGMAGSESANLIKTKRLNDKVYICGDFASDSGCGPGLLSSRVSIAANHQANAGIRLLLGKDEG